MQHQSIVLLQTEWLSNKLPTTNGRILLTLQSSGTIQQWRSSSTQASNTHSTSPPFPYLAIIHTLGQTSQRPSSSTLLHTSQHRTSSDFKQPAKKCTFLLLLRSYGETSVLGNLIPPAGKNLTVGRNCTSSTINCLLQFLQKRQQTNRDTLALTLPMDLWWSDVKKGCI